MASSGKPFHRQIQYRQARLELLEGYDSTSEDQFLWGLAVIGIT